jgi:APA family basic amino acid/polyamine antiporter
MSRDRLFPSTFTRLSRHDTPSRAIFAQALLGIAFLFFFDFNELTDNVVFISFFFYALAAAGLIVLRRTHPDLPRPYRVPFYPWLPAAYILVALTFVGYLLYDQVSTLSYDNLNRLAGLVVVFAGVPVFLWYRGRLVRAAAAAGAPPPPPIWGPDPQAGDDDAR